MVAVGSAVGAGVGDVVGADVVGSTVGTGDVVGAGVVGSTVGAVPSSVKRRVVPPRVRRGRI